MTEEKLKEELEKIGVSFNKKTSEKLKKYYEFLLKENGKINLTNIIEEKDVYLKHFYDSLTIAKVYNFKNEKVCDVGSGAGFPGVILAIFYDDIEVFLVESITKKAIFLEKLKEELSLSNINVINNRMENISQKFDVIVSRAAGNTESILKYSIKSLNKSGKILLMKGKNTQIENSNIYEKHNLRLETVCEFELPIENSSRKILVFSFK